MKWRNIEMAVLENIGKIFGMFDKIDDLVYEPVKLLCDAVRVPLKRIEGNGEVKKEERTAELEKQAKKFEVGLDLYRKEKEMKLSIEQRKLEEEINQMVLADDLQRREDMINLEVEYRQKMAKAAAELGGIMVNIHVDARKKVLELYTTKEKEYLELQDSYKVQMFDTVKSLREAFPDGSGEDIIKNEVIKQLQLISDRSVAFCEMLRDDMKKVFKVLDDTIVTVENLGQKYFESQSNNRPALTENIVNAIE